MENLSKLFENLNFAAMFLTADTMPNTTLYEFKLLW